MQERRRDHRIDVELPFRLTDPSDEKQWNCLTLDISPTGVLLELERGEAPPIGTVVKVAVQGPAEETWAHINTRSMRVVRVGGLKTGLTYVDQLLV